MSPANRPIYDKFSKYYDLIYQDRDYTAQCNFLEKVFHRFMKKPVKTVIDIGCGTGNLAVKLGSKGYFVVGVDNSFSMLEIARRKIKDAQNVTFVEGDVRTLDLGRRFDSCISLFSVFSYLSKEGEIDQGLSTVRRHLKLGGLFIFDFWNGLAVVSQKPRVSIKSTQDENGLRVIKMATPTLDLLGQTCKVEYRFIVSRDKVILDEFSEFHTFKWFFPAEMKYHLEKNGFTLLRIFSDIESQRPPNESNWYNFVIAKAN